MDAGDFSYGCFREDSYLPSFLSDLQKLSLLAGCFAEKLETLRYGPFPLGKLDTLNSLTFSHALCVH